MSPESVLHNRCTGDTVLEITSLHYTCEVARIRLGEVVHRVARTMMSGRRRFAFYLVVGRTKRP
jgi:hypothetical protein